MKMRRQMTPMKMSGSQVSAKLVTSSQKLEPLSAGGTGAGAGLAGAGVAGAALASGFGSATNALSGVVLVVGGDAAWETAGQATSAAQLSSAAKVAREIVRTPVIQGNASAPGFISIR